jgi:hypothetical protein
MRGPLATAALLAAASVACAAGAAPAAAAGQGSIGVSLGDVAAQLTYQTAVDSFGNPTFSQEQLQITRAGAVSYSAPVRSRHCAPECALETFGGGPLAVASLEDGGQPDVIVRLNTGGAHCCTIVQVFSYDPGLMSYRPVERDFGDPGALLTDVAGDGRLELQSADDRFAYAFTSFAFSGLPLRIWRFRAGRFRDVTRSFPKALAADSAHQFSRFLANRRQGLGLGFIAAWAADEYLLGRGGSVSATLSREARLGRLRSGDHLSPSGAGFVSRLRRFLAATGYLRR